MKLYVIALNYNGSVIYYDGTEELKQNPNAAKFYASKAEADLDCHRLNIHPQKIGHYVVGEIIAATDPRHSSNAKKS